MTEKVMTPTGWGDEFDLYKGATFSMAHSLDQMLHLRPQNRFEDIPGMYLVGGGTHPGSGLPVIFESAQDHVATAARRPSSRTAMGTGDQGSGARATS